MPQKLNLTPIDDEPRPLSLEPIDDEEELKSVGINNSAMPPADPGFLSKVYHAVSDPLTDAPSRFASYINERNRAETPDVGMQGDNSWNDTYKWLKASMQGGNEGSFQAAGDLVSGLSSPANIAMTVGTMGGNMAMGAGRTGLANAFSLATKAAAAPGIIHGAGGLLGENSTLEERGHGLVELAGNMAGALHEPTAKPVEVKPNTTLPQPTKNIPAEHGISHVPDVMNP